jgi:UDP-N-acetylglucosamine--N-acetylmuramyl-(pentapeptide) pyrophosphoryl-undecaprenol N-acetylglucosamine transferase
MSKIIKNKILLTGGGTGGSVTPLLALTDKLGKTNFEYLWIGTRKGIEKEMIRKEKINFKAISSTKLRRYFSPLNLLIPFQLVIGFIQSVFIIIKFRPQWIISAGGFVSVPVVWAGWLLGRKILIHQQDAKAGLANKLMAPFARVATVTFEKSLRDYKKSSMDRKSISCRDAHWRVCAKTEVI